MKQIFYFKKVMAGIVSFCEMPGECLHDAYDAVRKTMFYGTIYCIQKAEFLKKVAECERKKS